MPAGGHRRGPPDGGRGGRRPGHDREDHGHPAQGKEVTTTTLKTALKSPSPDWSTVQKETKTYAKYAADLPKNDPPKGDAADFKKLAKAFAGYAKNLDEAAQKEDLASAKTAIGKIGGSCKSCHDAHKEE